MDSTSRTGRRSGPDLVRPARGTRPANRRALIIAAAADLFYRNGYAAVGMSAVAEAVAIGPSALYRHFRGKQSLLATVVGGALDDFAATLDAAVPEAVAETLAAAVLARRDIGVLWRREAGHLSTDDRAAFRKQARRIGARLAEIIAVRRPELEPAAADLLAWSVLALANSVSFQRLRLPLPEYAELLSELISAVLDAPMSRPARYPVPSESRAVGLATHPRHAAIIVEATRLFAERGFAAVGVDEIGAAVGIAGPSVYHHFSGKADILRAAIARGDERLRTDLRRAIDEAADPRDGLVRLIASYSGFVFENPTLIQTLVAEAGHLPETDRRRAKAAHRSYIAEWVRLLGSLHPEWDPTRTRIRALAAQSMLNDLALTPHLRAFPDIVAASAAIGAELFVLR
ncbi:TetR/AcrR family transcriptional regulator [Nocardia altamirensis]|uniref:TetR/AcrR family transcriptional regulator n=1 Tax=Nocardia altamirensis TaxID=472158 RepID=UPI0009FE98F7|nr:TetR/AcrR family transcriptional regulator [Nocardia altamirensis]